MRHLAAGTHRIQVWAEHDAAGVLTVRSIPEIIFLRFTGDLRSPDGSPFKPSAGQRHGADRLFLYYWDWLDRHILKNVNVIQGGSEDNPFMPAWLAQGRREIIGGHFFSKNSEELQARWQAGFRPPFSGVIVDEFVPPTGDISQKDRQLGGYRPGLGFEPGIMDAIRQLSTNPELKGTFYAYLGMPSNAKAEDCRLLMETLLACHGKWVWEAYLWEQPSQAASLKCLDTSLRQRHARLPQRPSPARRNSASSASPFWRHGTAIRTLTSKSGWTSSFRCWPRPGLCWDLRGDGLPIHVRRPRTHRLAEPPAAALLHRGKDGAGVGIARVQPGPEAPSEPAVCRRHQRLDDRTCGAGQHPGPQVRRAAHDEGVSPKR